MFSDITYEVDAPVATITLNRPARLNAWTDTMEREVREAVSRAADDTSVFGIVITGAGRGFCAGADMSSLEGLDADSEQLETSSLPAAPGETSWGDDLRGRYSYLMSVPKPIVAAINGPTAGVAVALILCCDYRVMSREARLSTAFAERGLIAEYGTSWLLPRLVGTANALDLLMSSRRVTGHEAERIGLVNVATDPAEVVAAATAYIADMSRRCSPRSVAEMKRQVYQQVHRGLANAEREAIEMMKRSFDSADFHEGVQSFLEKRPPRFAPIGVDGQAT